MKYFSTNNQSPTVSLKEAVLRGLAPDGGLYLPESLPHLSADFITNLSNLSFQEIAYEVAKHFIDNELSETEIKTIINDAINFNAPLAKVYPHIYSLELFHGPTLAFKDFGARFMARLMAFFLKDSPHKTYILVATSGDTGSAVGSGFFNVPGFEVIILYPSQKISNIQEKQLTTFGSNVTALEIQGTFDDCQKLVKEAFQDTQLQEKINLSSANSINIARLIPQTFYYFQAIAQLKNPHAKVVFSVPTGNLGNLTAGIMAKKMGLPISKFIAAQNVNNTFYDYLSSGTFTPRNSTLTISNAMDVGNPSNFARLEKLYQPRPRSIHEDICAYYFSDDLTKDAIKKTYNETGYTLDPHGAVGLLALQKYFSENPVTPETEGIFLETAHPAKFYEAVEENIGHQVALPEILATTLKKEKVSQLMPTTFPEFKQFLLHL